MPPFYVCAGCANLKNATYCKKKDDFIDCFGYCAATSWTSPNTKKK
jgi:hypothetical protein